MYQPQSIQGQQMVGQNEAQVSQPVQMQPGIPVQGNQPQIQPSWMSQGQIVSSGQVPFPQPQPSRQIPATQTYEQQQPRPSIPSTYSQIGQQGQSLQQPKGQGQIYQEYPHKFKDTDFNSQMSVNKINLVDNKIININSKVRYKIKVSLNLR
jgi:hypothetical protein